MSTINKENPFRVGTKLYRIFEYMKDGEYHTLQDITQAAYSISCSYHFCPTDYRRVGSALRTIRVTRGLWITWDHQKGYRLEDSLALSEVVDGPGQASIIRL